MLLIIHAESTTKVNASLNSKGSRFLHTPRQSQFTELNDLAFRCGNVEVGHILKGLVHPSESKKASRSCDVETHVKHSRVVFRDSLKTIQPLWSLRGGHWQCWRDCRACWRVYFQWRKGAFRLAGVTVIGDFVQSFPGTRRRIREMFPVCNHVQFESSWWNEGTVKIFYQELGYLIIPTSLGCFTCTKPGCCSTATSNLVLLPLFRRMWVVR